MPKTKLKIDSKSIERLKVAADIVDVQLLEGRNYGEFSKIEVMARNVSDLFEMGVVYAGLDNSVKMPVVETNPMTQKQQTKKA